MMELLTERSNIRQIRESLANLWGGAGRLGALEALKDCDLETLSADVIVMAICKGVAREGFNEHPEHIRKLFVGCHCTECERQVVAVVRSWGEEGYTDLCYACVRKSLELFDTACEHEDCVKHADTLGRACARKTGDADR